MPNYAVNLRWNARPGTGKARLSIAARSPGNAAFAAMQNVFPDIRASVKRIEKERPWFTVVYDDGKGVMMTHVQASSLEVVFAKCPDALFVFQGYKVDLIERRAQRG